MGVGKCLFGRFKIGGADIRIFIASIFKYEISIEKGVKSMEFLSVVLYTDLRNSLLRMSVVDKNKFV
jgi:hypothetical protein